MNYCQQMWACWNIRVEFAECDDSEGIVCVLFSSLRRNVLPVLDVLHVPVEVDKHLEPAGQNHCSFIARSYNVFIMQQIYQIW